MHFNENNSQEQGRFGGVHFIFQTPPEKPKVETQKYQEQAGEESKEKQEKLDPRAMLADLSAEIGIEAPMKETIALERGLTAEGQKAEYTFQTEKLTATKEKDGVVWRNEKGETVQKAVWFKEKTEAKTGEHKKNLGGYWTEVSQKYNKDEKVRKAAETLIMSDLQKAEAEDIYNLQGGWDKSKMSRLFLGEQKGSGLTFKVDLKGKDKFESYVGAGDILPPTVSKILVIDTKGQQRTGERQIVNGRVGYFDAQGYIPIFSGYTISVLETISEGSAQAQEQMQKEQKTHTEMKGTIWRKTDAAPTELHSGISAKSGYRYAMVDGKQVEVMPPKPGEKVYEAKEPEVMQKIDNPEAREEFYQFGKERVYINVPKDMEKYKGKKPRVVVYFHGNGGSIDGSLPVVKTEVQKMRAAGDPVILVVPENKLGGWQDFRGNPDAFSRLMALTDQVSGMPNTEITLASHSGGYGAIEAILKSGAHYDRITTLGLLDSAYGASNQEFIKFAKDPNKKLRSTYTPHLADKNQAMVASLLPGVQPEQDGKDAVWHDESGRIDIRTCGTGHGGAPKMYFRSFVS